MSSESEMQKANGHTWVATLTGIGSFVIALLGFWGIATWAEILPIHDNDVAEVVDQGEIEMQYDGNQTHVASFYFKQGIMFYEDQSYDSAIASFNQTILINPKHANAYYYRGRSHYIKDGVNPSKVTKGDELALEDYSQAILLDIYHTEALFSRALLYEKYGEDELAIADYSSVITLSPTLSDNGSYLEGAFLSRGMLYESRGEYELAVFDYQQYLSTDTVLSRDIVIQMINDLEDRIHENS